MNANLFLSVDIASDEAWGAFEIMHGITHQTVYSRILQSDQVSTYFPLFEFPRDDNGEYLLSHWQVHQSNARALGIRGYPDIGTADFSDDGSFRQWLALHAQIHALENAVLGL